MEYTKELLERRPVTSCQLHENSPIPQEGEFRNVREVADISGFSHSVGTCGLKQGACKLSLNVKNGVIEEALIEVIGCSGMTQSAAMASEILLGKTLLEALNTDLVCDAINVAMREFLLAMTYGRTQSSYSEGGLPIGSGLEDLGKELKSQVGTSYGTVKKGPRYLEIAEGYVTRLGLDENASIIGYEAVNLGQMMQSIDDGVSSEDAYQNARSTYGRYQEAVTIINPRKE